MNKENNISQKNENDEKQIRAYMHNLIGRKKSIVRNLLYFIAGFVSIAMPVLLGLSYDGAYDEFLLTVENVSVTLVGSLFVGIITVLFMQYLYDTKIGNCEQKLIVLGIEDAKEEVDDDIYQNMIKISYKYLDEYYLQTRQQAQNGFVVTMLVSVLGAVIVIIGIGAMLFGKTTPAYVTTASGVITEFIAAVFFYLYNKTISSMSDYHNKLVLSQNISIALKIAESISGEEGEKAKAHIAEELMKDINMHIHSEGSK